ncbi:MAG TPA: hypothetical protein VF613_25080 [Longimicrobium sp.]|jgi:hypothetical protein
MEQTRRDVRRLREGRGIAALWFAVLAGPIAWMLGLNVQYSLVRVACAKSAMLPLHLLSLATLALAVAGGVVAWREWRRAGAEWPGEGPGTLPRSRFMAALGLLTSPLFALTILAQWVANLFLNPCMGI